MPTYHDLHITTSRIDRTSIFNLPYRVQVHCTRIAGWQVWAMAEDGNPETLLAGEFHSEGLVLDVDGHVIVDSLNSRQDAEPC